MGDELKDVKENLELLLNMDIIKDEPDWKLVKDLTAIPASVNKTDEDNDDDND
jgi:hypothetical protein